MTATSAPYIDPLNVGNKPGDGPLRDGGQSVPAIPLGPQAEDNLPSTWSKGAAAQRQALEIMRDWTSGPDRIRDRGEAYLPKDPGEQQPAYLNRLQRSAAFMVTGETVLGLTGFVFAKDPVLGADVPPVIVEQWENIDNAGTHGDVFAREQFQDSLTAGHNGILVEFPQTDGKQTAADEQSAIRPYWVPILKDNIVSWRTAVINGKTVLTQIVFRECTKVSVGSFGEKEQTNYRVLYRDDITAEIRGKLLHVAENKTVAQIGDGWSYPTQNEIPFSEIITSGRKSFLESKPPLLDLAFLNIEHYQVRSDRGVSIHKTCAPIWVETGIDAEQDTEPGAKPAAIVLGPNSARRFTNPNAKAGYESHDGAAIGEVTGVIEELKSDMASLGLAMLAPQKRAAETAEAKRLDKAASDSKLGTAARGLQDGIERALYFHARYLKLPSGGSISINRDFDSNVMDAATMTAWADLAEKLGIPVRVVLDALKKGGRLDKSEEELDGLAADIEANQAAKADQQRIEAQAQADANQQPPQAIA